MLRNLGLGTILVTSAFAVVVACGDSDDLGPDGASSSGSVDGSPPTGDGATTTADSSKPDTGAPGDSGLKPDSDAGCSGNQFFNGSECKACSGACAAGSYQTAACSATADRVCTTCTAIANCSTVTCTSTTDQTCSACANTHYLSAGTCVACSGACPPGQQQTAACSATADRVCTTCTVIPNCTNLTCTNATDQVCSACASNYYLSGNACVACSGACATGSYQSAACSATTDRVCSSCTAVAQCTSAATCTSATNSQCTGCANNYYLVDGTADTCAACSGACPPGQYQTGACGGTTDRVCSGCAPVDNCASAITCSTATDQQCTQCAANYVLVEGTADTCARPRSCAELRLSAPGTVDGVYTIDPDREGPLAPFDVYCDMTTNGGGWTLIGKVGNGKWAELTNQQYVDLVANPIADVNGASLLSGAMPATKEIAFFRKDRTNAIYHATPYAGESAVRVIWDSAQDNANDGTYFQQRKVGDAAWDFWAALRDSRRWSSATSPVAPNVTNYGTDFVLTRTLASFDSATNVVTHNPEGGDTSFGWWDTGTLTLADGSTLDVSRHGGLLDDGVNNQGWLWLFTLNPADPGGRFKNESFDSKSTIWLR